MKNNWTLRIVVFTVVCFGLAALFGKMAGEESFESYFQNVTDSLTNNGNFVSVYTEEKISPDNIDELNITTKDIEILVDKSKDENIHVFYYKKNDNLKSEIYAIEENKIKIHLDRAAAPKNKLKFNFNFKNNEGVGIVARDVKENGAIIQIPSHIRKIKIETVAGQVKVESAKLDEVKIGSVSGDIKFNGDIKEINFSTVSGDVKFQSERGNPKAKLSTISGDIKISFTDVPDFNFKFETTSGNLKFDKNITTAEIDGAVKNLKVGAGSGSLEISTVSGDVQIIKK